MIDQSAVSAAVAVNFPDVQAERLKEYPDVEMVRYRLAVGRNEGVMPKDVVGAIANEADIESKYYWPHSAV